MTAYTPDDRTVGEAGLRIVVNPSSGPALSSCPTAALRAALPAADVVELDGGQTCEEILHARPTPIAVGVSGGDGTVSAVASVAVELSVPMLVIPGGTLNHFARDLGIETVEDAIAAARVGETVAVDAAEIDGHLFLNNASIGAYPQLVHVRERWEHRIGKWPALVAALIVVLCTGSPTEVELDGRRRHLWFAFFGNCRYDQAGLAVGRGRTRLNDGQIDLRLVHADRRWARLRLIGAAAFGRLEHCSVYEAATVARVTVRVVDGALQLAADGEVFESNETFEVCKRPCALRVYAPSTGQTASGEPGGEGNERE